MIGEVLACERIERPVTHSTCSPVLGLTKAAMVRLHLKTGYTVNLVALLDGMPVKHVANATEAPDASATPREEELSVVATVEFMAGVSDYGCTLSHAAAFALQHEGRMPESVKCVAVVPNDALLEQFRTTREMLDRAVIDAKMLTTGHVQLTAAFWLIAIRSWLWPAQHAALPIILLAIALGLIGQHLWTSKRARYVARLYFFKGVLRRWATAYPTSDCLASVTDPAIVARECETMADVVAWATDVSAFRSSWASALVV